MSARTIWIALMLSLASCSELCLPYKEHYDCKCDDSDGFPAVTCKEYNIYGIGDELIIECKDEFLYEYPYKIDSKFKTLSLKNCLLLRNLSSELTEITSSKISEINGITYDLFIEGLMLESLKTIKKMDIILSYYILDFPEILRFQDCHTFETHSHLEHLNLRIIFDIPCLYHFRGLQKLKHFKFMSPEFKNLTIETNILEYLDLSANKLDYLPGIIFDNRNSLKTLILNGNKITSIREHDNLKYPNLHTLDLQDNKISLIDIRPESYPHLININLNNNYLKTFPSDLFPKLHVLKMCSSNVDREQLLKINHLIEVLDLKIGFSYNFTRFTALKNLTITISPPCNNFFGELVLECETLENLEIIIDVPYTYKPCSLEGNFLSKVKNLTTIQVISMQELSLENNFFNHINKIKDVRLSSSHIIKSNNAFKLPYLKRISIIQGLEFAPEILAPQILEISLKKNMFSSYSLSERMFGNSTFLQILDMSMNSITNLPEHIFRGLSNLLILDLSENRITLLPRSFADSLPNIRQINLSGNRLKSFDFERAINIMLGKKHIISDEILQKSLTQRLLNLNDNPSDILSSFKVRQLNETFQTKHVLRSLKLQMSTLKESPLCFCQFYDVSMYFKNSKYFKSLKFIDLDETAYELLCEEPIFGQLSSYMDESFQSMINPSECPGNCVENKHISDCSNRNLTKIPNISLFGNEIAYQKDLDLRNNKLVSLDKNFTDLAQKFQIQTFLSGNDWKCDCDDLSFIEFVKINGSFIQDKDVLKCWLKDHMISVNTPPSRIKELCTPRNEFDAVPYIIGFLFVVAVFIAIILILIYKLEIKIWLYSRNLMLWWVNEEEIDKHRPYDAFICYSQDDEKYVIDIKEVLESGPTPYKLCLHFRDWRVGEYIPNQIVHSVEQSKRSIFILTKSFMNSIWSKLEFRTAHAACIKEKRPRVILILCEEMEDLGELTEELKSYISTNTYLKWDDPFFWKRLMYALPHKKKVKIDDFVELQTI